MPFDLLAGAPTTVIIKQFVVAEGSPYAPAGHTANAEVAKRLAKMPNAVIDKHLFMTYPLAYINNIIIAHTLTS